MLYTRIIRSLELKLERKKINYGDRIHEHHSAV